MERKCHDDCTSLLIDVSVTICISIIVLNMRLVSTVSLIFVLLLILVPFDKPIINVYQESLISLKNVQ